MINAIPSSVHTPYKQRKSKEINEAESEFMNISPLNCSLRADPCSQRKKGYLILHSFFGRMGLHAGYFNYQSSSVPEQHRMINCLLFA